MFIIFASNCKGKSFKRTSNILDQYAKRIHHNTWSCGITQEGLNTVRCLLSKKATRFTDIQAFKVEKNTRLKTLWSIGKTKRLAIHTKRKRYKLSINDRIACLLAQTAGLGHDLGKGTEMFQRMLLPKGERNKIRHEWISTHIVNNLLDLKKDNISVDDIKGLLPQTHKASTLPNHVNKITTIKQGLSYLIISHHRLLDEGLGNGRHVYDVKVLDADLKFKFSDDELRSLVQILQKIKKNYIRLEKLIKLVDERSLNYIIYVARSGLILADHTVSSRKLFHKSVVTYANTAKEYEGKDAILNQSLIWHLHNVSHSAGYMTYNLITHSPISKLSQTSIENILSSSPTKYKWQDDGANCIPTSSKKVPIFLVNSASTGRGKTFANAKCAITINQNRELPEQFINVLNLRTLTTQTGTKYQKQYKLSSSEMTTIIGGNVVEIIGDISKNTTSIEPDEIYDIEDYRLEGSFDLDSPEFLDVVLKGKSRKQILSAGILNSTIDHIISAGNPGRQANQALAMLKLKNNVLILDEIDSYDTKALVDVTRLIYVAGLMNCSIILSSATVRDVIVDNMYEVFKTAVESRLGENCDIPIVKINEHDQKTSNDNNISISSVTEDRTKLCKIIDIDKANPDDFFPTINKNIYEFHHNNHFQVNGKNVSFGFIRFANIKPLIKLCEYISTLPVPNGFSLQVGSYHSNLLYYQRAILENRLDNLLNRNETPDYVSLVKDIPEKNIIFLVIASPVEEIGRDHDFDWNISEVSSMNSAIQGSGRVNRHRQQNVKKPNIGFLQYNYEEVFREKGNNGGRCFLMPGLESSGMAWNTHDVRELLGIENDFYITNNLIHKHNLFNEFEINALTSELVNVDTFCEMDIAYLTQPYYTTYSLRGIQQSYKFADNKGVMYRYDAKKKKWETYGDVQTKQSSATNWLIEHVDNYERKKYYMDNISVTITTYGEKNPIIIRHIPWGYTRKGKT